MERKFYRCEICGNIITHVEDSGVRVVCCGQQMVELEAQTQDATTEKHVPLVKQEGNKVVVHVGSTDHPMTADHYIQWIAIVTEGGFQIKFLKPEEAPEASFMICDGETVGAVYEYCNIHGLWKA